MLVTTDPQLICCRSSVTVFSYFAAVHYHGLMLGSVGHLFFENTAEAQSCNRTGSKEIPKQSHRKIL